MEHVHLARVEQQEGYDGGRRVPVGDKSQFDQSIVEVSRIESKATKAGRSLDTRTKIRRKRYPCWEARSWYESRMYDLIGWYFWGSDTHECWPCLR